MAVQRARSSYTDNIIRLGGEATSGGPARSFAQAPEAMLAAAAEGQRELLSFMAMRLEKDRSAVRSIAACQNWADVVHIQFDWMQEMLRDYGTQTSRIMALYTASGGQIERSRER
jgi:hypothetical protein